MPGIQETREFQETQDAATLQHAPCLLLDPGCYPHAVAGPVRMIETHISRVFLAGRYAYKVKKPVRLPFADFSTLEQRRYFCEEELRLNRRTAPELYVAVVPIGNSLAHPKIGEKNGVFEYAVKMMRFAQKDLGGVQARTGRLSLRKIDTLAACIARFHQAADGAPLSGNYSTAADVMEAALENFATMLEYPLAPADASRLAELRRWTQCTGEALASEFERRKQQGHVRECHGDLHLDNIVFLGERAVPFDCVEFNPALRFIDVMSDAAFTAMDVRRLAGDRAARRFINAYLEASGDYEGLPTLRFYLVYRALVRAKVALIKAGQQHAAPRLDADGGNCLRLAERLSRPGKAALVVMHGLAGSGKTTFARMLAENCEAICVRSDVERKRLHGLQAQARTQADLHQGIYSQAATQATYDRLKQLARTILSANHTVIVDAAFLERTRREAFRRLAAELGIPFILVSCHAPQLVLRRRVEVRDAGQRDASEAGMAVLADQTVTQQALSPDELDTAVVLNTEADTAAQLATLAHRL